MFGINSSLSAVEPINQVYDLSLGVAGFQPHEYYNYSDASGLPELKAVIRKEFDLRPDWGLALTSGAIHGIDLVLRTYIRPGDEVLIPSAYFPPYKFILNSLGAKVKYYDLTIKRGEAKVCVNSIRKNISTKTKLIILNFPHNPTGAVLDRMDAIKIADIIEKNGLLYLSDEVYSAFDFNRANTSVSEFTDQGFVVSSLSKSHGYAGLRLGWVTGPNRLVDKVIRTMAFTSANISLATQYIALHVMDKRLDVSPVRQNAYLACQLLRLNGVDFVEPRSGFFILIKCQPDRAIPELRKKNILVSSGGDFSLPDYIRICIAIKEHDLCSILPTIIDVVKGCK